MFRIKKKLLDTQVSREELIQLHFHYKIIYFNIASNAKNTLLLVLSINKDIHFVMVHFFY